MVRTIALSFGLLLLMTTTHARGDDEDAAAPLLRRGVELRREHRNEEALELFKAAAARAKSAQAQVQVALAHQALGHWLEAYDALERILIDPEMTSDRWVEKNRTALEAARGAVASHLGNLTVDVTTPGARILVDGEPLPPGIETRLVAGTHVVEVRAAGFAPDARRIDVASGLQSHLSMTLVPLSEEPRPIPASTLPSATTLGPTPRRTDSHASRVAPIVLGAIGVVGLGVGGYFALRALDEKSERDAFCAGAPPCKPEATAHDSNARAAATASTVVTGAGVAFLAAGITWAILSPSRAQPSAATFSPAVGPGFAGLVMGGAL